MEYKDYYKILGVDKTASQDEIKKVYRKLAMQHHPDHNPGDKVSEEKFKEINEAYQVLGNEEQRARYDRLGASYNQWQRTGGQGNFNWEDWFSWQPGAQSAQNMRGAQNVRVDMGDLEDMFGGGFSDFFNMIFGGNVRQERARPRGARAGSAQPGTAQRQNEHPVQISFQEAYQGAERMVQVNGRRLRVKIPPGARTGTKVRMANAGPAGGLGGRSDLFLVIDVAPDSRFERKNDDLYTETTIDLYTAVLGGQAEVDTPGGKVLLTIPAGTQPGQTFRLGERGMPKLKDQQKHGDLYVRVKVNLPRNLTREQQDLFEKLRNK